MNTQFQIIRRTDHVSSRWSGGTTTQLFIYPADAEYAKRNFLFRISTAAVETEKSDFTSLPGFHRKLMILDGELLIHHKDQYSKKLQKFEQDSFEGAWQTSAEGKVTDFNLMTAAGAEGALEHLALEDGTETPLQIQGKLFIYVYKGQIKINNEVANTGDFVCMDRIGEILILAIEKAELVLASVNLRV